MFYIKYRLWDFIISIIIENVTFNLILLYIHQNLGFKYLLEYIDICDIENIEAF